MKVVCRAGFLRSGGWRRHLRGEWDQLLCLNRQVTRAISFRMGGRAYRS
ncbi:hypothetical protein [Kibdelosporangium philippinense]